MPPRVMARRLALLAALAALAAASLPTASAAVEGEIRVTMTSMSEADIQATLDLTGEQADELRARADHDGDGEVGALEEAGAEVALGDRFEGATGAYTLDGSPYTVHAAGVDAEGLRGPADTTSAITLHVDARATTNPGSGPHVFEISGPPSSLSGDTRLVHAVTVAQSHRVGETEGFAGDDGCRAWTAPGASNASVELVYDRGACPQGVPAPGGAAVIGAVLLVAVLCGREREPL